MTIIAIARDCGLAGDKGDTVPRHDWNPMARRREESSNSGIDDDGLFHQMRIFVKSTSGTRPTVATMSASLLRPPVGGSHTSFAVQLQRASGMATDRSPTRAPRSRFCASAATPIRHRIVFGLNASPECHILVLHRV